MLLTSADRDCRYLAAPGTQADVASVFGSRLRTLGVAIPTDFPLARMVAEGWLRPRLRVPLPRAALESWSSYPTFPMEGTERCPPDDLWALDLYATATMMRLPRRDGAWWGHPLDDAGDPLTVTARANAVDPTAADAPTEPFRHPRDGRLVLPWIDFFAYWQAFHVSDLIDSSTRVVRLTEDPATIDPLRWPGALAAGAERVAERWATREPTFERLSRVRTAIGASVDAGRPWDEAVRALADAGEVTEAALRADVRDVLLVMWQEWGRDHGGRAAKPAALRGLLRQEIEYAVETLRCVMGRDVDFLDDYWYDPRQPQEWASLLDALPREAELARRDFGEDACLYVKPFAAGLAPLAADAAAIDGLVRRHWAVNRPLRRFAVAFWRLQRELRGERLMEADDVIRSAGRIEPFVVLPLHGERVLWHAYRERVKPAKHVGGDSLVKQSLNHALTRHGMPEDIASALEEGFVKKALRERGQLHGLTVEAGLKLVHAGQVGTGSPFADELVAAFVNLAIARNYAAHHDVLDAAMVTPGDDPDGHAGQRMVAGLLVAVLATLAASEP